MFSKACEYGIRSAIYIAEQSLESKKLSLRTVAEAIDSPEAYTSKILQLLSRSQIITSEKGPTGGYSMDRTKLEKVTLSDIVFAIDGDNVYEGCGLGLKRCNEKSLARFTFNLKKYETSLRKCSRPLPYLI